eukprot:TRINITY_DN36043_c0_g1_i1.p1 TRINITY_DN36043_c0_g1~~TRINITY_DN36043_c0_g1_i1.p1  ORF type:complete len:547 (-),score=60.08 TRINITY_DN36043_c0_g1_i1:348-1988(-)
MDLEDALRIAGPFGRYQKRAIFICGLGWASNAAFALVTPFITLDPEWRFVGDAAAVRHTSGPGCEKLFNSTRHWEWVAPRHSINSDLSGVVDVPCGAGKLQATTSSSAFFFGVLCGAPLLASSADHVGRKRVLFYGLFLMFVTGLVQLAASGFSLFIACRFFLGFLSGGVGLMCFVYPSEIVGKDYRENVLLLMSLAWMSGTVMIALLAAIISNWRTLSVIMALPNFAFFVGPCQYIVESPAFLVGRNRLEEARQVVVAIASKNGVASPEDVIPSLKAAEDDSSKSAQSGKQEKTDTFGDLARAMPKRLCIMCSAWMACSLGYYGISMDVAELGDNIYVTAVLTALAELPAYFLCSWMIGHPGIGRRWTLFICMAMTACACVFCAFLDGILKTIVAVLGKFAVAAAFAVVYLYGAELFPASVRSSAMGAQSTMARVGAILSPAIVTTPSPMLFFGLFAGMSLPAILFLPDTLGCSVPTTIKDQAGRDVLSLAELLGYVQLDDDKTPTGERAQRNAAESPPALELGRRDMDYCNEDTENAADKVSRI